MAKQSIHSKDFFVDAPDQPLKQTILSLPGFVNSIKYVGENTLSESVKFLYENDSDAHEVTVSLLPLTCEQTRVALHVTTTEKTNGSSQKRVQIVLDNFESAIHAALSGKPEAFQPKEVKKPSASWLNHFMMFLVASAGILFLWKKLS
jgi:hypothetical protein